MKAISHREHQALLTALQQLDTLLPDVGAADESDEQVQALSDLYRRYENLLSNLAACIAEYEGLQHHLKVSVLAPALRQARKTAKPNSRKYRQVQQYVEVARAI